MLARGARCVSFNSDICQRCDWFVLGIARAVVVNSESRQYILLVSFHDMAAISHYLVVVCEDDASWSGVTGR